MPWLETLLVGFKGLLVHKVRTLLSTLGIIFGISSVVAMLSIGEGARYDIEQQVAALGIETVRIVEPPERTQEATKSVRLRSAGLSRAEAEAFRRRVPELVGVAPIRLRLLHVRAGHRDLKTVVAATTSEYAIVGTDRVMAGRFILPHDEKTMARVAVLGRAAAAALFPDEDPLEKSVRIEHELYRVIGILAKRAEVSGKVVVESIKDYGRRIYVPLSTALHRMTRNPLKSEVDEIVCKVDSTDRIYPVAAAAEAFFTDAHGGLRDFQVTVALELLAQSERTQRIFDIVMGSIAGISLLVGGIGIMNIMLANISERRREIGIRRAVGARRRDVLRQFLVEASSICALGGVMGVFLGVLLAWGISRFADWKTMISLDGIMLSLGVSILVGVVFGTYPAWKAARMDPIEALALE
jgi:putative ABC transport system permease protein